MVEPLSLDEAFLDVTHNKKNIASATHIAQEILNRIKNDLGLSASAGVSAQKFLAKIASDFKKPGGLTVIPPQQVAAFVDALPIGKFFGVGKVTEQKMFGLGIKTGKDLKNFPLEQLKQYFGKSAVFYYEMAHGIDRREVVALWCVPGRNSYSEGGAGALPRALGFAEGFPVAVRCGGRQFFVLAEA